MNYKLPVTLRSGTQDSKPLLLQHRTFPTLCRVWGWCGAPKGGFWAAWQQDITHTSLQHHPLIAMPQTSVLCPFAEQLGPPHSPEKPLKAAGTQPEQTVMVTGPALGCCRQGEVRSQGTS